MLYRWTTPPTVSGEISKLKASVSCWIIIRIHRESRMQFHHNLVKSLCISDHRNDRSTQIWEDWARVPQRQRRRTDAGDAAVTWGRRSAVSRQAPMNWLCAALRPPRTTCCSRNLLTRHKSLSALHTLRRSQANDWVKVSCSTQHNNPSFWRRSSQPIS